MPHTHTTLLFWLPVVSEFHPRKGQEQPFMTLLSMNEITTFRWSLEQDIEHYQEAGYRAIGVWRQKLNDDDGRALQLLADSDLVVSNLLWAGGFTGSDGRTLEESIEDAREATRLAASIGARCLVVYPGGRNNHTFRHAGRLLRTALDQILPLAESLDVPLAIEPMHPACAAEWTFLTEPSSVLDLIDEYGTRHLKLAIDTYHFPLAGAQRRMISRMAEHLAVVHLGDRCQPPNKEQERCLLGCGQLQLVDVVRRFQAAGFQGPFDVLLMGQEIEASDYWMLLEHSQAAFAELAGTSATRTLA
jgi:sugar phosphate isomerase/epimerase